LGGRDGCEAPAGLGAADGGRADDRVSRASRLRTMTTRTAHPPRLAPASAAFDAPRARTARGACCARRRRRQRSLPCTSSRDRVQGSLHFPFTGQSSRRDAGSGRASQSLGDVATETPSSSGGNDSFSERVRRKMRFPNLSADDFRHPLDKQNTRMLKLLPGLEQLIHAIFSPVSEQLMLLENVGSSVQVSEEQLPNYHKLLVEACAVLDLPVPELYVRQHPQPNAYTLAIGGRAPFIVVHTALLELLEPEEIQCILAHELGHLKCEHGVWLTAANLLGASVSELPMGGLLAANLEENLLRWLRAAELTCDRAALLVTQDPRIVCSALMKLAGGSPKVADHLNVDAFLKQARSYQKASASPLGWYLRNAQEAQLSHPLPVLRAREIEEFSRSKEYLNLVRTKGSRDAPST